jgi:SAM-dependent methyltransferase
MKNDVPNDETAPEREPEAEAEPWLPTWDASYAANTGHHRRYDAAFLATTPLHPADRLLDLGCGSGDFTRIVADRVPDGHVVGLDPQPALLAEARAAAGPNQSFVSGPVQRLDHLLPAADQFAGVYSRAAMQWVPAADHAGYLEQVVRLLKPGGWFRLEMGGAGNIGRVAPRIAQISKAHGGPDAPWTFPDPGRYLEQLQAAGFVVDADPAAPPGAIPPGQAGGDFVRSTAQRRPFDRDSLLGWLRSQCYQGFEIDMPAEQHAAFRADVEAHLDDLAYPDGTFDQTYVRLDALARTPV